LEIGYDELKTHMLHRKESLRSMMRISVIVIAGIGAS
jgi:hypothetical protein